MYTCSRFLNEKENNINKNTTNNNKKLNESKRLPKQFFQKKRKNCDGLAVFYFF